MGQGGSIAASSQLELNPQTRPSSYQLKYLLGALASIGAPMVDIFGSRVKKLWF